MSDRDRDRQSFVVCEACDVTKAVEDPNDAVSFYRRHHSITAHDVEWGWADFKGLDAGRSDEDLVS
ncbi:hypothetical protein C497_12431, partial [Halalkalicoccus jeotgali B3]